MGQPALNFALVVLWIVAGAFQYGFHISALNGVQDSITCATLLLPSPSSFPTCVPITKFGYGVLTSSFTIGGLLSSIYTGASADKRGRRGTAIIAAVLTVVGGCTMAVSSGLWSLVMGRVVIGLACGISTVLVPLFLSEVAPVAIRGSVGVLTQLSICSGILLAQAISIPLSKPETGRWRIIPLVSAALALIQILTSSIMIESPKWLADKGGRVFDVPYSEIYGEEEDEESPSGLLAGGQDGSQEEPEESLTLREVFSSKEASVRRGLKIILFSQLFQQASGINSVMYYSTLIMSAISPSRAKYIALFITLVNLFMTLPAVYLIERLGRRTLLLNSMASMALSSLILAWAINTSRLVLAATFIVLFVASFSMGLGPIPFVLMGEAPPPKGRSATASAGLGLNWAANFAIGLLFLPFRDWLSGGDENRSGTVFFLFAGVSAVGYVVLARLVQ